MLTRIFSLLCIANPLVFCATFSAERKANSMELAKFIKDSGYNTKLKPLLAKTKSREETDSQIPPESEPELTDDQLKDSFKKKKKELEESQVHINHEDQAGSLTESEEPKPRKKKKKIQSSDSDSPAVSESNDSTKTDQPEPPNPEELKPKKKKRSKKIVKEENSDKSEPQPTEQPAFKTSEDQPTQNSSESDPVPTNSSEQTNHITSSSDSTEEAHNSHPQVNDDSSTATPEQETSNSREQASSANSSTEETPKPEEDTQKAVEDAPKPTEETLKSTEDPKPKEETPSPTEETPKPEADAPKPAEEEPIKPPKKEPVQPETPSPAAEPEPQTQPKPLEESDQPKPVPPETQPPSDQLVDSNKENIIEKDRVKSDDSCEGAEDKEKCVQEKLDQKIDEFLSTIDTLHDSLKIICKNSPILCKKIFAKLNVLEELKMEIESPLLKKAKTIAAETATKISDIAVSELEIRDESIEKELRDVALKSANETTSSLATQAPSSINMEKIDGIMRKAAEKSSQKSIEDFYEKIMQRKETKLAKVKADKMLETLLN